MKKLLVSLAAMAIMGMMMTSCQKNEGLSKETFTATTESNTKTHLDGLSLKWDNEGESIMVYGLDEDAHYASQAIYFATSVTNDGTCATFACAEGEEVNAANYMIFYPASVMPDATHLPQLPAVQDYAENSVKGFPMYAETQSHTFQFCNLCGLFRLQLQKTGVSIRSITITADNALSGECWLFPTRDGKTYFAATSSAEEAKTVTLDCGVNGVSIDNLTDFNIYLPVGTYNTFDITIMTTDGRVCAKSLNGSILTINRNERVTLTRQGEALRFSASEDAINGAFSVDADGHQVYFAKGNLQNINGEWRFAEHQYDYLGTYSATAWDLFGWSTAATNYGMTTSTSNNDYDDDFIDWGNAIGNGWHTLSFAQWNYVTAGRQNADDKRASATVCGIQGMILLPDEWTLPTGMNFNNGFDDSWTRNVYNINEWALMEAAGAVFLPAAGGRNGTLIEYSGEEAGGFYWTSSPNDAPYANILGILVSGSSVYGVERHFGVSVRLVQDAN